MNDILTFNEWLEYGDDYIDEAKTNARSLNAHLRPKKITHGKKAVEKFKRDYNDYYSAEHGRNASPNAMVNAMKKHGINPRHTTKRKR